MAKIKITEYIESNKVRFDSLKEGELFAFDGKTYIKMSPCENQNAVDIMTGEMVNFFSGDLCIYVKEANLSMIL